MTGANHDPSAEQNDRNGRRPEARDREAPLSRLNEALESPPSDAEAEAEPTNPVDSVASQAVGSPSRAALLFNALGIALVLAGFGAIGLGLWALQPVWLWLVIGIAGVAAGGAMFASARRRRPRSRIPPSG